MSLITIRKVNADESDAWQKLWAGYIEFYESQMPAQNTAALWRRILDPEHSIQCRVAVENSSGKLIGLVHFFPHVSTWSINPVCYLNDLYVLPGTRGSGTGKALIEAVVSEARDQGWDEVYWLTQQHNAVARGLYDKLSGGSAGFVNYIIDTSN